MSEYRYDLLRDKFSIIAPERLTRPNLNIKKRIKKELTICPFCKGNENLTPKDIYTIKDENGDWKIRVIPNLYKALEIEGNFIDKKMGMFDRFDGFGAHEIIIDTSKHITSFEDLDINEISLWIETIKQRVDDLSRDLRLRYFSIFKNQGEASGSTMPHVHTQLISLELLPQDILNWFKYMHNYYKKEQRDIFEDIIEFEKREDKRVISEGDNFICFAPFGSSFAFELLIVPKFKISNIAKLKKGESYELAFILKDMLKRLKRELGDFDYNLTIEIPPLNINFQSEHFFNEIEEFFRFHIRIIPRLYKNGGFELQSGVYINPLRPEIVAKLLKKDE